MFYFSIGGGMAVAQVFTVAFEGVEAREVAAQVHIAEGGSGQFIVVGLADKAVAEARERVRAALSAIGLALPYKRITVNLAPADLPKEGSHYDLPIALALLAANGERFEIGDRQWLAPIARWLQAWERDKASR